jgi:PTS system cellobiose-specific IIB component
MKRVLFVCSAGMSTSLIVEKTLAVAKEQKFEVSIEAIPEAELKSKIEDCDLVLLGPQVRYLLGNVKKIADPQGINVSVMDPINYGRLNGAAILEQIKGLI